MEETMPKRSSPSTQVLHKQHFRRMEKRSHLLYAENCLLLQWKVALPKESRTHQHKKGTSSLHRMAAHSSTPASAMKVGIFTAQQLKEKKNHISMHQQC